MAQFFIKCFILDFYRNKFQVFKYVFFDLETNNVIACVPIIFGDEKPLFNVYNGIIFNKEISILKIFQENIQKF